MRIPIKVGDRWAIVGGTGSGKTVLARAILKTYIQAVNGRVPVLIVDSKITGDFDDFTRDKRLGNIVRGNSASKVIQSMGRYPVTIWRPEEDDFSVYEEVFRGIYLLGRNKNRPAIVMLDELSSVCNAAGKAPRHWDILNKQGRGMNIGMINLTQSPSFIPASLLRQATHMIRMQVNDEYDVKKLAKVMGQAVLEPPIDDYGFWYRSCLKPVHKSPPHYFADYTNFIGAA